MPYKMISQRLQTQMKHMLNLAYLPSRLEGMLAPISRRYGALNLRPTPKLFVSLSDDLMLHRNLALAPHVSVMMQNMRLRMHTLQS